MPLLIRPMQQGDLAAVHAVQCAAYPAMYHEPVEALGSRLLAGADSCFVAEREGMLSGYVLAHAWRGAPPLLHVALEACATSDHVFLHDLAVHPDARGAGVADALVQTLLMQTALQEVRLVAVRDAAAFWLRAGFVALDQPLPDCYGAARLMVRAPVAGQ